MVKRMTGYGRAKKTLSNRDITVEVRSVNNRYLDCTVKLPRAYIFAEDAIKGRVQKAISRGKVDVFVTIDSTGADEEVVVVNEGLARSYLEALRKLYEIDGGNYLQKQSYAADLARIPDVLTVTKAEEDLESVGADICEVLDEALASYNQMRATEGKKLAEDIGGRLTTIETLTGKVEERSPETVREYREKLTARMQEVLQSTTIDESRILTEAAIYADKVAVDEETVRLRSHVSQLRDMLLSDEPMGRKMDFLIQEVNRESNTIGSKCNDVAIARDVVALKAEVEKIREQVQNIEKGAKQMKLLNIGFGNMVSAERLIAVVSPDSAPIKRLIQESRERGMLIDATYGRKTASVFIMDSDHVVLSAIAADKLIARLGVETLAMEEEA